MVTLSVTDSSGANNSTSIVVVAPTFDCPLGMLPFTLVVTFVAAGLAAVVGVIGLVVAAWLRRRPPAITTALPNRP